MASVGGNREAAVRLAKQHIVDVLWKTANIEVDGITFPDTQEIFDGRAPAGMAVDDVIAVNNIKRAWMFLFDNVDHPVDWAYVSEYNRIVGEGLVANAGGLRANPVSIGGTSWVPDLPDVESSRDRIGKLQQAGLSAEERAIGMFCAITRGQWFPDGNKRTALMVANHVLVNAGVGMFAIAPGLKREFTTLLLEYYESDDAAALSAWLSDNAVERLPGGLTDSELRNLPNTATGVTDPTRTSMGGSTARASRGRR